MHYDEIGNTVRRLRKEKRLTQSELARSAGISRVTLSKLENNHIDSVSIQVLFKLLDRLGFEFSFKERSALPVFEDLVKALKSI